MAGLWFSMIEGLQYLDTEGGVVRRGSRALGRLYGMSRIEQEQAVGLSGTATDDGLQRIEGKLHSVAGEMPTSDGVRREVAG